MLNIQKLKIDPFVSKLRETYRLSFGSMNTDIEELLAWAGHLALENLANCDALYHNIDHTIMVTLVGQEIIKGRQLNKGGVSPEDWLHFVVALLCHDIGYVKGVCKNDCYGKYDDGFGNPPEFWEVGIFDNDNVMIAYLTFDKQTKDDRRALRHLVTIQRTIVAP